MAEESQTISSVEHGPVTRVPVLENRYVVQRGDTLSHIANRVLGSSHAWHGIAELNGLTRPDFLLVGQILKVPRRGEPPSPSRVPARPATQIGVENLPTGKAAPENERPADLAIARGFMFVAFEQLPEVGQGRIIRKVLVVPKDFSLHPTNPARSLSLAEHVMGDGHIQSGGSPYLSGSTKSIGASSMFSRPPGGALLVDLEKVRAAGGRVFTVQEVVADLRRFVAANPASLGRVQTLIWAIEKIEGEILIQGSAPATAVRPLSTQHSKYVARGERLWESLKSGEITRGQMEGGVAALEKAYRRARIIGRVGRVLTVVGVVFTVKDLTQATQDSVHQKSFKPISKEVMRQVGGWGGTIVGAKLGAMAGAALGVELGPGAVVTGAIGAIVFGAIGYFGMDFAAQAILD
jgi:LysM repeat protein